MWGLQSAAQCGVCKVVFLLSVIQAVGWEGVGRLGGDTVGAGGGQRHGTANKLSMCVRRSQLRALHKHYTMELYHQSKS